MPAPAGLNLSAKTNR